MTISKKSTLCLTVLLPLVLKAWDAGAQSATVPKSGVAPDARVRYTHTVYGDRVGRVLAVKGDTLHVRSEDASTTVAVPLSELTRLEVSRGRRGQALKGAGIGLLSGVSVGAAIGYFSYEPCGTRPNCIDIGNRGTNTAAAAIVIGAGATLAGGVIGALSRTDRWQVVPLESARVGLVLPSVERPGVGFSVTASF